MDNLEMIEKLMEKANVTYEEAKGVLESVKWNLLDALIALEKEGKIKTPEPASYTTKQNINEEAETIRKNKNLETFGGVVKSILNWIKDVIVKGMNNSLCIVDVKKQKYFSIPLTLLVLFMIPAFWLVVALLAIEFFSGCSFMIEGPDLGPDKVNDFMEKIRFGRGSTGSPDDLNDRK